MKKTAAAIFSFAMLASFGVAFAQEATIIQDGATRVRTQNSEALRTQRQQLLDQRKQARAEIQKKKEEFKAMREKLTEQKCAMIQQRMETRTSRFDNNKERHMSVYKNLKDRIGKFIARAEEKGYDTTKPKADLKVLDEKINKFAKDYAAHVAKLKETKTLACGHSEGEFRSTLLDARELLKVAHQDAADIRNYYQTVIRPDIRALRDQKPKTVKPETSTSTPTSNQ